MQMDEPRVNKSLKYLSGYLLSVIKKGQPFGSQFLRDNDNFEFLRQINDTGWELFNFTSKTPLLEEDKKVPFAEYGIPLPDKFIYPIVCRWSGSFRVLVLSSKKQIVDHLLNEKRYFPTIFKPNLQNIYVKIDRFVKAISNNPDDSFYFFSSLHARVPSSIDDIKTISFYGDDITESKIFRKEKNLLVCYKCGVKPVDHSQELLQIGSNGSISLSMPTTNSSEDLYKFTKSVEQFLDFLGKNFFLYEKHQQQPEAH